MRVFRVRFHPGVEGDLRGIADWLLEYAGPVSTARVIEQLRDTALSLKTAPHRGTLRNDILPGLRAIPSGRRGVIAFTVDDELGEVFVHLVTYAGADWQARMTGRQRSHV
ncbi:type II toxin-antitoxin system RelE/ParE family toxin [Cereibacter sp. SYSU M97828]|nr:type II toxin-antitoxin system RelE/ParE family toxin [Cereibacter flavus]